MSRQCSLEAQGLQIELLDEGFDIRTGFPLAPEPEIDVSDLGALAAALAS